MEVGLKQGIGGDLSGIHYQGNIATSGLFIIRQDSSGVQPENLLHLTSYPVPLHGIAVLSGRDDYEAVESKRVLKNHQSHSLARYFPTMLENAIDILPSAYDLYLRKASSHRKR